MKNILKGIFIGTLLGGLVGIGLVIFWYLPGALTSWKLLGSPVKFEHITKASIESVLAETVDKKIYHKDLNSGSACSQWTEKTGPMIYWNNPDMTEEKGTCVLPGIKYPQNPLGHVVECVRATDNTSDAIYATTYYALLDDGTIWYWSYDDFPQGVANIIQIVLFSLLLGFAMGLIASLIFYYLVKTKITLGQR